MSAICVKKSSRRIQKKTCAHLDKLGRFNIVFIFSGDRVISIWKIVWMFFNQMLPLFFWLFLVKNPVKAFCTTRIYAILPSVFILWL